MASRLLLQTHPCGYFKLVELLWTLTTPPKKKKCDGVVPLTYFTRSLGVIICHTLGLRDLLAHWKAGKRAGHVGAPQRRKLLSSYSLL